MKRLLKIIVLYILVFCILPTMNTKAVLAQNADNPLSEDVGLALINVRTPDDFDETVYLEFINEEGQHKICPVFPETDYMIEEMIGVGTYRVTGHLDKDLILPYDVEIITPIVSISADSDAFIEVSVIPDSDSLAEPEDMVETEPDTRDDEHDSEPVPSDTDRTEVSDDDSNAASSTLGTIVTLIAAFIIVICIVIFVGFIHRHREE